MEVSSSATLTLPIHVYEMIEPAGQVGFVLAWFQPKYFWFLVPAIAPVIIVTNSGLASFSLSTHTMIKL